MSQEPETTVAWSATGAHAPVIASDGVEVGHVVDVAALPEEDIFHGIVFTHQALGHHLLAPAQDVDRITDRAVYLRVPSQQAQNYERFHETHIERLQLRGIFRWKHLGWKHTKE